tara:strand:+ start:252 stop:458 length:207 start_codon:yes stop_codon:yes gene_type:complete
MRIRVVISETFTTEERRIVNAYFGKKGLAPRARIESMIRQHGDTSSTDWSDIMNDGRNRLEEIDKEKN